MTAPTDLMFAPDSLWIAPGTPLPAEWRIETSPAPGGWSCITSEVKNTDLEKQLRELGWAVFFIASPMVSTIYGFRRQKMLEKAAVTVQADVRKKGCNSMQIDQLESRSFWGLPYISISAHPRHIQEGFLFAGQ